MITIAGRPVNYLALYMGITIVNSAWEQYLRWRRLSNLRAQTSVPNELKGAVTQEKFEKAQAYTADKNGVGFLGDLFGMHLLVWSVYLSPWVWQQTGELVSGPYMHICIFSFVVAVFEAVTSLPMSLYSTFVVEERWGFNKQTYGIFFKDKLKGLVLNLVITFIMYCGLVRVLHSTGPNSWFYCWAFLSMFVFVFNVAYPKFIAPMFNTFTPLRDGVVKDRIFQLINDTGLRCKDVFEVDGSRQSSHSNAYVAGMCGTKRIVVYDTLMDDLKNVATDVCAVVGHEIGHSVMHHTWAGLLLVQANFFLMFFTYGFLQKDVRLVTDFGYEYQYENGFADVGTTFLLLNGFMSIYSGIVMPAFSVMMNAITRQMEYAADAYSVKLGYDIRGPLLRIAKTNLGDLSPDWLDSLWHHNHPTLIERMRAVTALLPKKKRKMRIRKWEDASGDKVKLN